jgi:hypothetical protein
MDLVIPYGLIKNQIASILSLIFKILHTEHTLLLHISEKKKTDYPIANFPFTINFATLNWQSLDTSVC